MSVVRMTFASMIVSMLFVTSATPCLSWAPPIVGTEKDVDADGDKLSNYDEFVAGTNPLDADTDDGGCWDGWELFFGFDPTDLEDDGHDPDADGWSNHREYLEGTDPLNPNTDGDNYPLDSTDPHPLLPDNIGETVPGAISSSEGGGEGEVQNQADGGRWGQGSKDPDIDSLVEFIDRLQ